MVTNEDGHITQNVVYIPYGEVFVEERNGSWTSPYLFNAKELDEETGLYYYGARYLDPTTAVWLSVDPKWKNAPDKTPYNYCLNNPVKLVDPDGRAYVFRNSDEESLFNSYISMIDDESLLDDYKQLKDSPIEYHVFFVDDEPNLFSVGSIYSDKLRTNYTAFRGLDLNSSRQEIIFDKNKSKYMLPFIRLNENDPLVIDGKKYSFAVSLFHELRHAAIYDACVRHFDLNDNSCDNIIRSFLNIYNQSPQEYEGWTGPQIYDYHFTEGGNGLWGSSKNDSPTERMAMDRETEIARYLKEIGGNQRVRNNYGSVNNTK